MRDVAIVGAGMTRFGEIWQSGLRDLFAEAALAAIDDAGVDHLDSIYVGNMSAGRFVGQEHLGPLMADQIGMAGVTPPRVTYLASADRSSAGPRGRATSRPLSQFP